MQPKNAPSWWQTRKETGGGVGFGVRQHFVSSAEHATACRLARSDNAHVAATASGQPQGRHSGPFDRLARPLSLSTRFALPPLYLRSLRSRRVFGGVWAKIVDSFCKKSMKFDAKGHF